MGRVCVSTLNKRRSVILCYIRITCDVVTKLFYFCSYNERMALKLLLKKAPVLRIPIRALYHTMRSNSLKTTYKT